MQQYQSTLIVVNMQIYKLKVKSVITKLLLAKRTSRTHIRIVVAQNAFLERTEVILVSLENEI